MGMRNHASPAADSRKIAPVNGNQNEILEDEAHLVPTKKHSYQED